MSQGGIKIGRLMKDEGKINPTFIKKNHPNDFIAVFTTYVNVQKIKKAQKGPYEKQSAIIFVVSIYVQMSTVKFDKVGLVFFKANRSYRTKRCPQRIT